MSAQENKRVVRRLLEEVMSGGKLGLLDELVAADYVDHDPANPPDLPAGREGLKQLVSGYRAAFPDVKMTVEDQIAQGDKVVTRWTARGTHKGDLMGISATGKQVTITGIFIDRVAGGKLVESWANWDTLGMLQQLGAVPEPARAGARS